MNSFFKKLSAALLVLSASVLSASCDHNTYKTNNSMIPVGRLVFNPECEDAGFAFSALGEVGVRNYRANLTAGSWTTERTRLKITGEYLTQKLSWNFSTGRVKHWVHQGAGGLDWQYLMDDCSMLQAIDVKGYYSYSGSKDINDGVCSTIGGPSQTIDRRLAGANAAGGSLSGVFLLSDCSRLDLSLDYDHVKYRRRFSHDLVVEGLGGSFVWTSRLPNCMDFALEGQFRRPFNYLGARLTWPRACGSANTTVTLFGGVTRGKYSLPNSAKVGLELVYNFSVGCCDGPKEGCPALWDPCDLNAWVLVPAVYMPEVLVIADKCGGLTSSTIPNTIYTGSPVDVSSYFFSKDRLTYSAIGLPEGLTLDAETGVISGTSSNSEQTVTVTATNGCTSTSQSFLLLVLEYLP